LHVEKKYTYSKRAMRKWVRFDTSMDTHTVYISLGSNSGNREGMLLEAYSRISEKVAIPDNRSSIYETAAWGNKDQPAFLNAVLSVQTKIKPDALLGKLLGIEKEMGRKRGPLRWTERCIDLDILFFNSVEEFEYTAS
jgi:2-amino-4-hydroxy-6-hydroxymethyldihydropteridine diphosphokinase